MKKYLDKIRSLINRTVDRYGYDKALRHLSEYGLQLLWLRW